LFLILLMSVSKIQDTTPVFTGLYAGLYLNPFFIRDPILT
jgi:hypothetical protein